MSPTILGVLLLVACAIASPLQQVRLQPGFPDASSFLAHVDERLTILESALSEANWNYETNITQDTLHEAAKAELVYNEFVLSIVKQSVDYTGETPDETRQLDLIRLMGSIPWDVVKQRELADVVNEMKGIFATATVTKFGALEPELVELLATSRDEPTLRQVYLGWRESTARLKPLYEKFVTLANGGAADNGFDDVGTLWRSMYDMDESALAEMMDTVWREVLPLYKELHCYVRHRLHKSYRERGAPVDELFKHGLIPAHLTGNMWGQDFSNVYDIVIPFADTLPIEMTPAMRKQNYTVEKMHQVAEDFYKSLGYDPLPPTFWTKSMLVKPENRQVVCHASAWDFLADNSDLRIKMCTKVTGEDLLTIHHEQGHLVYDHHYRNQPALFRRGSADFSHEAIGDTMELSVVTPSHLASIGLLDGEPTQSRKQLLNYQMAVALSKVAILPWAFLVDKWRWEVFDGELVPERWQERWEELVEEYQGLSRPEAASESAFDPGSKAHVASNTPYLRYFGAAIVQFQFHEALCKAAGHKGPIHDCDIYNSKAAGRVFGEMMSLGQSVPWPEALRRVGAGSRLSGKAMLQYFAPLHRFLQEENRNAQCGWRTRHGVTV